VASTNVSGFLISALVVVAAIKIRAQTVRTRRVIIKIPPEAFDRSDGLYRLERYYIFFHHSKKAPCLSIKQGVFASRSWRAFCLKFITLCSTKIYHGDFLMVKSLSEFIEDVTAV
jgi:hypothetical protein